MSNGYFLAQHSQTQMYIARREVPRSEIGSRSNGAAHHYKWVRTPEEAERFQDEREASLALHFVLGSADWKGRVIPVDPEAEIARGAA